MTRGDRREISQRSKGEIRKKPGTPQPVRARQRCFTRGRPGAAAASLARPCTPAAIKGEERDTLRWGEQKERRRAHAAQAATHHDVNSLKPDVQNVVTLVDGEIGGTHVKQPAWQAEPGGSFTTSSVDAQRGGTWAFGVTHHSHAFPSCPTPFDAHSASPKRHIHGRRAGSTRAKERETCNAIHKLKTSTASECLATEKCATSVCLILCAAPAVGSTRAKLSTEYARQYTLQEDTRATGGH